MKTLREELIKFSKYREDKAPYSAVINHEKFVEEYLINSSNEPDEAETTDKHEEKKNICPNCGNDETTRMTEKYVKCGKCGEVFIWVYEN